MDTLTFCSENCLNNCIRIKLDPNPALQMTDSTYKDYKKAVKTSKAGTMRDTNTPSFPLMSAFHRDAVRPQFFREDKFYVCVPTSISTWVCPGADGGGDYGAVGCPT
ncbi:hypothetical protein PHYPSEUDO_011169 [Phytophthora pseudosyringae]|uniref:Uncharacterized protein n=1 Tax=Phytophthora pseudosyringae TaxID=221518 RepID=A0A8T1V8P3_9STRA|nr:hypothetical protein PHYPSEUDO_011169 [Phytophthora pseudosyringae]